MALSAAALSFRLDSEVVGYVDPTTGLRMLYSRPEVRPDLWTQYLNGLEQTYLAFGTERALDLRAIFTGRQLPIFAVAIDDDNRVVGGLRAHGPLVESAEAHALQEFEIDPVGQATVRRLLDERIPAGVAEIKGVWTAEDAPHRRELSNALARGFVHMMTVLNIEYTFCTAAEHAARRWLTAGGEIVDGLEPVAYPDERYRTTMMWWHRDEFAKHCDPEQLRRIRMETEDFTVLSESGAVGSGRGGLILAGESARADAGLASLVA